LENCCLKKTSSTGQDRICFPFIYKKSYMKFMRTDSISYWKPRSNDCICIQTKDFIAYYFFS